MGGYSAILEGDSFSVIQWCSRSFSYPWRLEDCVEEVQDISRRLGASFHHILREVNVMADSRLIVLLGKEFFALPFLLMFSYFSLFSFRRVLPLFGFGEIKFSY